MLHGLQQYNFSPKCLVRRPWRWNPVTLLMPLGVGRPQVKRYVSPMALNTHPSFQIFWLLSKAQGEDSSLEWCLTDDKS